MFTPASKVGGSPFFKIVFISTFFLIEVNVISAAVISPSVQQTWSFYYPEICQLCSGTSVFHPNAAAYNTWVGRK